MSVASGLVSRARGRARAMSVGVVMVVFEVLLVDVVVGVYVVAVVVFVGVFDVGVGMLGVRVLVGDVAVVVLMAVAMLEVAGVRLARGGGFVCVGRVVCGAGGAEADDREVAEACVVAEGVLDRGADRFQAGGVDAVNAVAAFADEVLALAVVVEGVEAGAVADVDVAHDAGLFEVLEVAVHRAEVCLGHLAAKAGGDVLG